MLTRIIEISSSLDVATLVVIASCVTLLLGVFLLFAYVQDRVVALAWWGLAYLLGGSSAATWWLGSQISLLPAGTANVLLFVAVGMIWSAARLFHGRPISWAGMFFGAGVWLAASMSPALAGSAAWRVIVSSLIVAAYTFLIAGELWRERRKSLIRRWPAIFVPMLHGAIFLFPMALASLSLDHGRLARGWVAVFAIQVVLYVVGAAFIVLMLAKDRTVRAYKAAALADPLTGLFNRRGFFEAAADVMAGNLPAMTPVSVLAFDLDHFKSINDNYGHATGDAILQTFAKVVGKTMRAGDVIGRIGGEEFVAIISGTLAEAAIAAERVRSAFAAATLDPSGHCIAATVSVGAACGSPKAPIESLIARADAALYRAKANGRNRLELADEAVAAQRPEVAIAPRRSARLRLSRAMARRGGPTLWRARVE